MSAFLQYDRDWNVIRVLHKRHMTMSAIQAPYNLQALYEHETSANRRNERGLCAVETHYEQGELDVSTKIAQYGCSMTMSAFHSDERDMSAIRTR